MLRSELVTMDSFSIVSFSGGKILMNGDVFWQVANAAELFYNINSVGEVCRCVTDCFCLRCLKMVKTKPENLHK